MFIQKIMSFFSGNADHSTDNTAQDYRDVWVKPYCVIQRHVSVVETTDFEELEFPTILRLRCMRTPYNKTTLH